MSDIERFDEIRKAILEFLDDVMQKAHNENMARVTDVMIQRPLRDKGYQSNEVNQELMYLVEIGYVKKKIESSTGFGTSKLTFKTTYYYISSKGRDFLHGSSKQFKTSSVFGGININNIQGAVAIGENSIAVVHKPHLILYNALGELKEAVLDSKNLQDEDKREYVADIETIRNQVAKKIPNKAIISAAWKALGGLVAVEGLIQFVERVRPLIESLIK